MTDQSNPAPPKPEPRDPERVAVISLHTSPRDQPGSGDSGGMNVYVLEVARRLAEQGIGVDIFTRRSEAGAPEVDEIGPGNRLIQVRAGPRSRVAKKDLPGLLQPFLDGVIEAAAAHADSLPHKHSPYDVVHSHYWLSGWVGSRTKEIWGAPHVTTFHTLGRVKNDVLPPGDRREPRIRLAEERRVIQAADRILAPTALEAEDLVSMYGADRERIRVVPPGVDGSVFVPRRRREALRSLRLHGARLVLFVGRLQPFKGPDIAIGAFAEALRRDPALTSDLMLAVVGGPTERPSRGDEVSKLMDLAASAGVGDRVLFFPPQPHRRLVDFYSAAEVVLVPSRTESFGLVALEAQACGTPVIASYAGGLRDVVAHGETGFLVPGREPGGFAEAILSILAEPALAGRLSRAAVVRAGRFSWDRTARDVRDVYRELGNRRGG